MSKTTNRFSPEVRERAVRLLLKTGAQHPSRWQAVMSIAAETNELRQANDILRKASAYSAMIKGNAASLQAIPAMLDRRSK